MAVTFIISLQLFRKPKKDWSPTRDGGAVSQEVPMLPEGPLIISGY